MTVAPVGPHVPGARRDEEGERRRRVERSTLTDPGTIIFWAQVPLDGRRRARARRDARHGRRRREAADHRRGSRARRARRRSTATSEMFNDPEQARRSALRSDRDAATGASSSSATRPMAQAQGRRRAARGARIAQAREPHRRHVRPGRERPIARRRRRPSTSPRWSKDYKGDAVGRRGRVVRRRRRRTSRRARSASRCPNGMKVALLPKKTRGETVRFTLRLHQGDEKSLFGTMPCGEPDGRDAGARNAEARPAGVRGRARPASREARDFGVGAR